MLTSSTILRLFIYVHSGLGKLEIVLFAIAFSIIEPWNLHLCKAIQINVYILSFALSFSVLLNLESWNLHLCKVIQINVYTYTIEANDYWEHGIMIYYLENIAGKQYINIFYL